MTRTLNMSEKSIAYKVVRLNSEGKRFSVNMSGVTELEFLPTDTHGCDDLKLVDFDVW